MRAVIAKAGASVWNPMRGTFAGCCAIATEPPKTKVRTIAMIFDDFRVWILDFRTPNRKFRTRSQDFSFISCLSSNQKSRILHGHVVLAPGAMKLTNILRG